MTFAPGSLSNGSNTQHATRNTSTPSPTAVILFTSGSEGVPKGVELSHTNLLANIRQMLAVTDIEDTDRLFNCLPVFHSFGLTVGTLVPLVRGAYSFHLSFTAALPRHSHGLLRSRLHHLSQHEHISERLRAQGPSV